MTTDESQPAAESRSSEGHSSSCFAARSKSFEVISDQIDHSPFSITAVGNDLESVARP